MNMNISRFGFLCVVSASLVATVQASFGQQARNCSERDRIVMRLAEGYGERRKSIGLGANNSVIELYASDDTGTWTILMTYPSGMSCLMATGSAFEATADEPLAALDTDA